jgi:hypothetical protein
VQAVHGVAGHLHGGLEAEGVVRAFQVVVDGLGDTTTRPLLKFLFKNNKDL